MLHPNFVILGAIIGSIGAIAYLIDTLKGKVKPNKVTFILWALAPLIAFIGQIQEGVGILSLLTFSSGFFPLLIFIASFFNRKAEWKLTRFDLICGALSVVGLLFYLLTRVGNVAIFFGIFADGLAALPTIVKSYHYPETENGWVYLTTVIGASITLFTIDSWDFANWGFPVYLFIVCTIIFILVQFKTGKKLAKS